MALLEIRDLSKVYRSPEGEVSPVLDVPSFSLEAGEQVALFGESGSGKTTFLNVIAGILTPDSGSVTLAGTELTGLSEGRRDAFRAEHIGYVFQTFHLLEGYSALENVLLGMSFGAGPDRAVARELLAELGLAERAAHRPAQLSVGQRQRVALARALANRPNLILADEPTGNLDAPRSRAALELIRRSSREHGAALLLVSHDPRVLDEFDRCIPFDELNGGLERA